MTELIPLFEKQTISESPEPLANMIAREVTPEADSETKTTTTTTTTTIMPDEPEVVCEETIEIYQPRPYAARSSAGKMAELARFTDRDERDDEDTLLETVPEERPGFQEPRPTTPRRSFDSSSAGVLHSANSPRSRNRSPYSRTHLRAHSSSASLMAPPMTRAHSLPTVINGPTGLTLSPSPIARPASPLRSPARSRSPFKLSDEPYIHSGMPSVCDISEDSELDLTPKNGASAAPSSPTFSLTPGNTFPRRRAPASPLHQVFPSSSFSSASSVSSASAHSSPLLNVSKFNERFPSDIQSSGSFSSSSVPSTPTSARSRSPSISSLETIPDTPDAEEAAIEADRIARLKAAAEKAERGDNDPLGRGSLDVPGPRPGGFGFGGRDKRKRWSVCGAERRGDLDLETIWED